MADTLESTLYIYFITADRGIRNGFAGTGQTRKRSTVLTRVLAENLYAQLAINYVWRLHGVEVPAKDVVDFITEVLLAVPDDVAKMAGTRTASAEPATKNVTHGLFLALDLQYEREYINQNYLDRSSPNYINRAKA